VDTAETVTVAEERVSKLTKFLDLSYNLASTPLKQQRPAVEEYVEKNFPPLMRAPLMLLPVNLLSPKPLYELLEGFKMDLGFIRNGNDPNHFPIKSEDDFELYAYRVAGTVAEMVLELIFSHSPAMVSPEQRRHLIKCGGQMGRALQYVNIARDLKVDAAINRVYLPASWLKQEGLTMTDMLSSLGSTDTVIGEFRARVLDKAFSVYEANRPAMEELPLEGRGPIRVAIESYMEIGRVLQEKGPNFQIKTGRATVPKLRRLSVAWNAMSKGRQGTVHMSNHFIHTNGALPTERRKTAIVIGKTYDPLLENLSSFTNNPQVLGQVEQPWQLDSEKQASMLPCARRTLSTEGGVLSSTGMDM
jgi:15-cis-phytoene synthase/lycopene beta-cyclase